MTVFEKVGVVGLLGVAAAFAVPSLARFARRCANDIELGIDEVLHPEATPFDDPVPPQVWDEHALNPGAAV